MEVRHRVWGNSWVKVWGRTVAISMFNGPPKAFLGFCEEYCKIYNWIFLAFKDSFCFACVNTHTRASVLCFSFNIYIDISSEIKTFWYFKKTDFVKVKLCQSVWHVIWFENKYVLDLLEEKSVQMVILLSSKETAITARDFCSKALPCQQL